MSWNYKQPVEILFGNGRLKQLDSLIKEGQTPLLVTDPFFLENGFVYKVKSIIGECEIFAHVSPNPDVREVNECSALIREKGVDLIIALGGGSSIDLAKAASVGVEKIEDYHGTGTAIPDKQISDKQISDEHVSDKHVSDKHIPIIAIPTTAGTGSEVTCVSVLTNRKTGKKAPIVSEQFYPKVAIVDPELTYSLPPHVTASTGIDVLCHAVEGYWSKGHQPICDALAIHAIKLVLQYLPIAYDHPKDITAREKLAEASVIAGLAFTLPKTTSSHACSFPLTSIYHIPHGEACGLTLDYFARVNSSDIRTRKLAKELGYSTVDAFADDILSLKKRVNLRCGLKDFDLSKEQTEELVKLSHHPNLDNNPVEVTDEILFDLYKYLNLN